MFFQFSVVLDLSLSVCVLLVLTGVGGIFVIFEWNDILGLGLGNWLGWGDVLVARSRQWACGTSWLHGKRWNSGVRKCGVKAKAVHFWRAGTKHRIRRKVLYHGLKICWKRKKKNKSKNYFRQSYLLEDILVKTAFAYIFKLDYRNYSLLKSVIIWNTRFIPYRIWKEWVLIIIR